jgi:hypothetical protein
MVLRRASIAVALMLAVADYALDLMGRGVPFLPKCC